MTENVKKFMELVSNSPEIQQKMVQMAGDDPSEDTVRDCAIKIAKENGIVLTIEDLDMNDDDLSVEELEQVVGGRINFYAKGPDSKGDLHYFWSCGCVCPAIGVGSYDENQRHKCFCFAVGVGETTDKVAKWTGCNKCLFCPAVGKGKSGECLPQYYIDNKLPIPRGILPH